MTARMGEHAKVFAKERMAPPPKEIYALHRKLSGAIVTCTKLKVQINCRKPLVELYTRFQEGKAASAAAKLSDSATENQSRV